MKRFHMSIIAVFAAVLLTGSLAMAHNVANVNQDDSNDNQAEVEQLGNSSIANIDQSYSEGNTASVYQKNRTGSHQNANIYQSGKASSWNSGQIDQVFSQGSNATIDQNWTERSVAYIGQENVWWTDAEIEQHGGDHMASIHQSSLNNNFGDHSHARIEQHGWFQSGKITQKGSRYTKAHILQTGDYHKAEIVQFDADDSKASIKQSGVVGYGNGNKAKITQTYVDYSEASIEQWGERNRAWINQFDGDGLKAEVIQKGKDNKATVVHQTGDGHDAKVHQGAFGNGPCRFCNAVVYQHGTGGHNAHIDQNGYQLTAYVAQTGQFENNANVSQIGGSRNLAIVIQGEPPELIRGGCEGCNEDGPWKGDHAWKNGMPMDPDMPWIPFNREIRDPKFVNWTGDSPHGANPYRSSRSVFPGGGVFLGPN